MENYLEKDKKRALTLYKKELKKKYALKKVKRDFWNNYETFSNFKEEDHWLEEMKEKAAYLHKNMRKCSCCMCGNPRNQGWSFPLTLQEDVFNDKCHPDNKNKIKIEYY